jgi:chlorite dismutase
MPPPLPVWFVAGAKGEWHVDRVTPVIGEGLPAADRLTVTEGQPPTAAQPNAWSLHGVTSNTRYTSRIETDALLARQEGLRRREATRAALIPIRKSDRWWALAQDERRTIMQETSRHIDIGMEYLPAIARRLHHCRDIGGPFDFLTWFEFAPEQSDAFEQLTGRLRQTEEWLFVDREVDIRLSRFARVDS